MNVKSPNNAFLKRVYIIAKVVFLCKRYDTLKYAQFYFILSREKIVAHLPHLAALKHLNMKQGLLAVLWPEKETMKMETFQSMYRLVHRHLNETEQRSYLDLLQSIIKITFKFRLPTFLQWINLEIA